MVIFLGNSLMWISLVLFMFPPKKLKSKAGILNFPTFVLFILLIYIPSLGRYVRTLEITQVRLFLVTKTSVRGRLLALKKILDKRLESPGPYSTTYP